MVTDFSTYETEFPGIKVFSRVSFADGRGLLSEVFQQRRFAAVEPAVSFVQDNFSRSETNVLRGLHYQLRFPQAKCVTVLRGAIIDVGLDVRRGSPSFGKWFAIELSEKNQRQLYLPIGFAHGFYVTEGPADVLYKCSNYYVPDDQFGIRWNDTTLAIDWQIPGDTQASVSERDAQLPTWNSVTTEALPEFSPSIEL